MGNLLALNNDLDHQVLNCSESVTKTSSSSSSSNNNNKKGTFKKASREDSGSTNKALWYLEKKIKRKPHFKSNSRPKLLFVKRVTRKGRSNSHSNTFEKRSLDTMAPHPQKSKECLFKSKESDVNSTISKSPYPNQLTQNGILKPTSMQVEAKTSSVTPTDSDPGVSLDTTDETKSTPSLCSNPSIWLRIPPPAFCHPFCYGGNDATSMTEEDTPLALGIKQQQNTGVHQSVSLSPFLNSGNTQDLLSHTMASTNDLDMASTKMPWMSQILMKQQQQNLLAQNPPNGTIHSSAFPPDSDTIPSLMQMHSVSGKDLFSSLPPMSPITQNSCMLSAEVKTTPETCVSKGQLKMSVSPVKSIKESPSDDPKVVKKHCINAPLRSIRRGRASNRITNKKQRAAHQAAAVCKNSPKIASPSRSRELLRSIKTQGRDSSPPPTVRRINGKRVTMIDEKQKVFVIDLLSPETCDLVRRMADDHVRQIQESGNHTATWRTLYTYTKQDLPCTEVKDLTSKVTDIIMTEVKKVVGEIFGKPREAAKLRPRSWKEPHLLLYQKVKGRPIHTGVEMHYDGCDITWNAMLAKSTEYEGGGTYIRAIRKTVRLEQGQVLVHPGELYHKGVDITSGVRALIVCFMDGFDPRIVDQSSAQNDRPEYVRNVRSY